MFNISSFDIAELALSVHERHTGKKILNADSAQRLKVFCNNLDYQIENLNGELLEIQYNPFENTIDCSFRFNDANNHICNKKMVRKYNIMKGESNV